MLLLVGWLLTSAPSSELTLFSVQKSENKNELVYFVRVDTACHPVGHDPVAVRWHMRERNDTQWEELLPTERNFYALAEQQVDGQRVLTHVRAAAEHPFTVTVRREGEGCIASAEADVDRTRATIAGVAVEFGFLSVKKATLFGRSLADGRAITERIQ